MSRFGGATIARTGYVFGVKETIENLRAHGVYLSKTAVRRALYAGAVVMRDEAKRRVPVRYGALKKAIVAETRGIGKDKRGRPSKHIAVVTVAKKSYTVGTTGKLRQVKRKPGERAYSAGQIYPRNYAHLVEFGTKPHSLGPRGGRRYGESSGAPAASLMHPGSRPKPFMRPAFDTKLKEAEARFAQVLKAEGDKALQKARSKTTRKGRR
jgi:HK97 gp10 family phage protein